MEERLRRFLRVALWMLVPLLVYETASALIVAVWSFCRGEAGQELRLPLTAVSAVVTVFLLGWFCPGDVRRMQPGFRGLSRGTGIAGNQETFRDDILFPMAAGIGICLCLNHLLMLLPFAQEGWQETAATIYLPPLWLQILCTGFVIPAVEELIFRGYAFRSLRQEMSFFSAACVSSIYFGLFHGTLYQGFYAFLVGLLLAVVCERRRNLFSAWIVHAAANLTAVVFTAREINGFLRGSAAWLAVTAAAGGAVVIYSVYRMRGK